MGVYLYTLADPLHSFSVRDATSGEDRVIGQLEFGYKLHLERDDGPEARLQSRQHNTLMERVQKAWPEGIAHLAGVVFKGSLVDLKDGRRDSIEVMPTPPRLCQADDAGSIIGKLYRKSTGELEYESLV